VSDEPRALTYSYRPLPFKAEAIFKLGKHELEVENGRRSGKFRYNDIELIRLSYALRNTLADGYKMQVRAKDGRTLRIANASWKSMVEMETHNPEYRAFADELCRKVFAANPSVRLEAGLNRFVFPLAIVAGGAAVALALSLTLKGFNAGAMGAMLVGLGFATYFGWFCWRFLSRNQPRIFVAKDIPADVLPV